VSAAPVATVAAVEVAVLAAPVAAVVAVVTVAVAVATVEVTVVVSEVADPVASAALADATGMHTAARQTSAPASSRREDLALRIHTVPNSGNDYLPLRHTIAGR
jgi:hypothetical protein